MTSLYLLLTGIISASLIHTGECTKCYVCTSANDPKCTDPMMPDDTKAFQCTSDVLKQAADIYNSASKKLSDWSSSIGINVQAKPIDAHLQCSKVDISDGDKKVSIRGCTMPPTESFDPCKTLTEKYSTDTTKVSFCGVCNSDYCNGAPALGWSAALVFPLVALLLSYYN